VDFMPGVLLQRRDSSGGSDPERAYDISADLSGGSKLLSDYDFFRAVVRLRGIISPTPRTRLVLRFTQGWNTGSDAMKVPPSLRFFAGGDNSVRGFSYLSQSPRRDGMLTGGRYLTVGSAEFQFPLGSSGQRGAVFLDAGKAYNHLGGGEMLYGPGIGYRYPSRFGTVRVDLAAGISDSDTGFKLHFAFGPEF
ncbi:MAG: autotransporter assembly complex family protein, partial [Succinivibrio sp.]